MMWFSRRRVALSGTISACGDGSERENASGGVVVATSNGIFRDHLSHGSGYPVLLNMLNRFDSRRIRNTENLEKQPESSFDISSLNSESIVFEYVNNVAPLLDTVVQNYDICRIFVGNPIVFERLADIDGFTTIYTTLNLHTSTVFSESLQIVESRKELWDSLEAKYMAKDASSKKFLVSCIIDKLRPSWNDFKHTLKHKKEELTLVKLGSHLRIEESLGEYLCDLNAIPSLGNKKYFVTFIDDASRTDKVGEYMDTLYFQIVGIIHETTALYTLQQNGISERKNRVLKEMVNSMLSYLGLSQGF
ncbi:zinc finger, CCHC-type containing protein [Tanacetum coccineum]